MESLRIEKKDTYIIEVNDAGETIEFDLVDISLPMRFNKAYLEVEKSLRWLEGQIALKDKETSDSEKVGLLTKGEEKLLKAWDKAFKDMRKAMDNFLGEGGCQKVFGDRNYLEMWSDLLDALEPHIEKMGIRNEDIKNRIKAKYSKKDEGVLK